MTATWKVIEFEEVDTTKHYIKDEVPVDLDSLYLKRKLYTREITVASPDGLKEVNLLVNDDTGMLNAANYADVTSFGAIGDGVHDDTPHIQDAIDSITEGMVFFPTPSVTYKRGILTISGKTNFTLNGNNALQTLAGDDANIILDGTCTNITLTKLNILGDGILASGHYGIGNFSGQTLQGIRITDNKIKNVVVGISVNADTSGTCDDVFISDNEIDTLIGVDAGQGYGINQSNCTNVKIVNNTINKAQRHSIYSGRGGKVLIQGNYIRNHREDAGADIGNPRAAIDISRGNDISVIGNLVDNSYSPAIMIIPEELSTLRDFPINGILVSENVITAQQQHICCYVGYTAPADFYPLKNVHITGNIFKHTLTEGTISIMYGFNVNITNNTFIHENATGEAKSVILRGLGTVAYPPTLPDVYDGDTFSGNWNIFNNSFILTGAGTGVCLRLEECCVATFVVNSENNYPTSNMTLIDEVYTRTNPNMSVAVQGIAEIINGKKRIRSVGIGLELQSVTNSSGLKLINAVDRFNWIIASNYNTDACLEITPSTVEGGDTFTNASLKIFADGKIGFSEVKTDTVSATDFTVTTGAAKTLVLSTSAYKDINIAGALLAGNASVTPDEVKFLDSTGADTGIYTYGFGIDEGVHGGLEIQHDYKEGTDLVFHVHWAGIAAPSGTDNVKWRIMYSIIRGGAVIAASTTLDSADTAIDTQYKSYRTDFTAITGTGIQIGDQFMFSLFRIAATGDAYAGDALIQTAGIHYQVDTLGSRSISTK